MLPNDSSPVTDLMNALGIGAEDESTNDEGSEYTNDEKNLSLDSDNSTSNDEDKSEKSTDTETDSKSDTDKVDMKELLSKIDNLEKRLSDKDRYINELRNSNPKKQEEAKGEEEDDDFWSDPEAKYKSVTQQLKIANLRIDENIYALNKPDYFDIVNGDNLQKAFRDSPDFQQEFQSSSKPYDVAYKFLKSKLESKSKSESDYRAKLREEVKQELLKEMGNKQRKEAVPNPTNIGGKSESKSNVIEDGFASVFGQEY